MLGSTFRPWGILTWLLSRSNPRKWSLLGALATGERSLAALRELRSSNSLANELLLRIRDEDCEAWRDALAARLTEREAEYLSQGGDAGKIKELDLFVQHSEIYNTTKSFLASSGDSVVIDISALPKRFFFPITRIILESGVRDILVTYTVPEKYADDSLAGTPEPWRTLPMFMPQYPEPTEKVLIVGLGYELLGLPSFLVDEDFRRFPVRFLFPFPASPKGTAKNWTFLQRFKQQEHARTPYHVNAWDVSEIFDRVSSITDFGKKYAMFAPYGPKTMSLAMCLYAIRNQAPVFYTQPKHYNPLYSSGVKEHRPGVPEIYAYYLRLNGVNYY